MGWSHRLAEQRRAERQQTPMNDRYGCSTCPKGQERHEEYYDRISKCWRFRYDYRTPDGTLFTCIDNTLADCQARRNAWLVERAEAAQRERQAAAEDAKTIAHEYAEGRCMRWEW